MAETSTQSGDPGRTPGSAEGDRETVEADLQQKQQKSDSKTAEQSKDKK